MSDRPRLKNNGAKKTAPKKEAAEMKIVKRYFTESAWRHHNS